MISVIPCVNKKKYASNFIYKTYVQFNFDAKGEIL